MSQIRPPAAPKVFDTLWLIDRRCPILHAEHFMENPDGYIKEIKVINRSPKSWRGICLTYNRNSTHERAYKDDDYLFFESLDDARKHLLSVAAKRHEELSQVRARCGELMASIMRLRNEQN